MTEQERQREDRWAVVTRFAPGIGAAVLIVGAVVMAMRIGVPAAILWFGFAALAGAILLFWEALRSVVDPESTASEAGEEALAGEMADLEARKRGAVKALRDLDFEHSIGRMSDEDYKALREKYRGEARAAMEAIDQGLGTYLVEAQKLVADAAADATGESTPAVTTPEANDAEATEAAATESSETTATTSEPGETVASAERVCASCATKNDADAVFCKRCAARLEGAAS